MEKLKLTKKEWKTEMPEIVSITKVIQEAKEVKSFFFRFDKEVKPGQFIMLWIPGVDEKPYAISYQNGKEMAITSHAIGPFTKVLDKMKKGDKIGVRGPYGKGFSIKKNACVIGGGVGMASVSTLIDALHNPTILIGARSKEHIVFKKRYPKAMIATDDGSEGFNGFVTELFRKTLPKKRFSMVYTCGPEIMMKKIIEICNSHNIDCEASVERYMKCGYGICGNCVMDDKLACVDGPVFNRSQLNSSNDFGKFACLKTGKKVTLQEYYGGRA